MHHRRPGAPEPQSELPFSWGVASGHMGRSQASYLGTQPLSPDPPRSQQRPKGSSDSHAPREPGMGLNK